MSARLLRGGLAAAVLAAFALLSWPGERTAVAQLDADIDLDVGSDGPAVDVSVEAEVAPSGVDVGLEAETGPAGLDVELDAGTDGLGVTVDTDGGLSVGVDEPVQRAAGPPATITTTATAVAEDDTHLRDEILVLDAPDALAAEVSRLGFRVLAIDRRDSLGLTVTRLAVPPGLAPPVARDVIAARFPGVVVDLNSLYRRDQLLLTDADYAPAMVGWPARCAASVPIGIVDTGVDPTVVGGSEGLEQRDFVGEGGTRAGAHGTAVAALLAGSTDAAAGLLSAAPLRVAAAFPPDGEVPADAARLIAALDWLVSEGVGVVNMSLSGPRNELLAVAIERVAAAGVTPVAAVGNGGPGGPPAYPAALATVIAVTAVDGAGAVMPGAGRGAHVDLAAPGVALRTALPGGRPTRVSGTSFAAPFVTAAAAVLATGRQTTVDAVRAALAGTARDLGVPGPDPIYGAGLLQAPDCP